MRSIVATLVAAIALSATPALAQEAVPQQPERAPDVVLAVEGFSCEACTDKLQKKLAEIEGTEAVVAAEWEEGTISIWLQEEAEVEDEALAAVVADAGFVLKEVRRAQLEPATGS
jgi:copper chaperone CopZ